MLVVPFLLAFVGHQGAVTFRFMPQIGKTYRYQLKMDMTMQLPAAAASKTAGPMTMKMTTDMAMKAVSRSGDITTMQTHMSSPQMSGALAAMAKGRQAGEKTMESKMDSHFGVKSMTGVGNLEAGTPSPFSGIGFPNHPVRVGDTWTNSVDMAKLMGAMGGLGGASTSGKLTMRSRLLKIERVDNIPVAMISVSTDSKIPFGAGGQNMTMHLTGSGTLSMDIPTGMVRELKMPMDMSMAFQGQTMKMHMAESFIRK